MECVEEIAGNGQRLAADRQIRKLFRLSPTTNPFYLWAKPARCRLAANRLLLAVLI